MWRMIRTFIASGTLALFSAVQVPSAEAQAPRPLSPRGTASAHVQGKYVKPSGEGAPAGVRYEGGKWVDIAYGRPIKRGRDLWGSGADYGRSVIAGAPVWRAGADVSTRLTTEVPLVFNGKPVPAGEYSVFIDLKPNDWTFVLSTWAAQPKYDPTDKTALWGAYGYTPDKDVVRAPMKLETLAHSVEQLTWEFLNMTDTGGVMAITWDRQRASVPFTFAK
jgi:hypothetical protein